jgi:LuxR family transcriptional regulator, maltose regulon positive regulatory protein
MPRKEHKSSPKLVSGILYTDDTFTGAAVGSARWFTWLQTASTFYYEGKQGTFTARRETKQRGGSYWVAYRQIDGKLRKSYLGKPEALTADRLASAAAVLAIEP